MDSLTIWISLDVVIFYVLTVLKLFKCLQVIFPENHIMPRLFTSSIAEKYEDLYKENSVKFLKVFMHPNAVHDYFKLPD